MAISFSITVIRIAIIFKVTTISITIIYNIVTIITFKTITIIYIRGGEGEVAAKSLETLLTTAAAWLMHFMTHSGPFLKCNYFFAKVFSVLNCRFLY